MPRSVIGLRRRTFLAAAASLSACRPSGATPAVRPPTCPAPPPITDEITEATFAEAEKLMGVKYTAAERHQMLDTVEDLVATYAARRGRPQPNDLAPATTFDPWPPGRPLPTGPSDLRFRLVIGKPGSDDDIAYASVTALGYWLRTGAITSRRLTELYLRRLDAFGPKLECVVTSTPELALAQADRADQAFAAGEDRGPLQGIPWGAKDILDTAGIATTWGAAPYADRVPETDAVVVARLTDAGAVLVAKLTTGALAYGDIWHGGRTRNPWNMDEGSSGSSAGPAAAVAAGLVGFAVGTETLGSIVSPSMRCGTVGLRPTFGRVARTGCMTLSWTLDKIGPIARSVEGAAAVLAAVHGADPGDPSSRTVPFTHDTGAPLPAVTVGYDPRWFQADTANDVERSALDTLSALGVTTKKIELPDLPYSSLMAILFVEAATAFEELTASDRDDELVWQGRSAWPNSFRWSRFISGIDYLGAQRVRRRVMNAFAEIFADVDVLIGPSYAGPMLLATNASGHPSLTLRAGFVERSPRPSTDGEPPRDATPARVPHGITLWGKLYDERTLCRLGVALEDAFGVRDQRPPIA